MSGRSRKGPRGSQDNFTCSCEKKNPKNFIILAQTMPKNIGTTSQKTMTNISLKLRKRSRRGCPVGPWRSSPTTRRPGFVDRNKCMYIYIYIHICYLFVYLFMYVLILFVSLSLYIYIYTHVFVLFVVEGQLKK